jgi:hypothetical protein
LLAVVALDYERRIRNMRNHNLLRLAFSAALLFSSLASNAGLFQNGGFENLSDHTAIPPGGWATINPGDTWLTGWSIGGPGGDIFVNSGDIADLSPVDGQYWICFNGGNTPPGGYLSQTFTTSVGMSYTMSFFVGVTGSGNVSITATALAADGGLLASNRCIPTSGSGTWRQFHLNFTASTSNTTVCFKDTSTDTYAVDVVLDAVSVAPAPPVVVGPFVNGSFEFLTNHAAIPSGGWAELAVGDTWLVGWTVGGPGNDLGVVNGTVNGIPPYDGEQWICFNGGDTPPGGSLSQTFLTAPGTNYDVSFYVYKTGTGNVSIPATAQAAGGSLLASNYCAPAGGVWTQYQFNFTAVTTNTMLEFLDSSTDTIAVGIELDGVTVVAETTTPVPPPPPPPVGPFVNGSFELLTNHAAIPAGGWAELAVGDTWLVGWTVGGPGDDLGVVNGTVNGIPPYDGEQWICFNGGNTPPGGSLSQTFLTVPGTNYDVSFYVYKTGTGNVSITATAPAAGGPLLASNYCAPTGGVWTEYQMSFTATTSNTTLKFLDSSIDTIAVDIELDDVTVVARAPAPVTPPPPPPVGSLVNGSFETPVTPTRGTGLNPGDTWLTGWTIGGPGGDTGLFHGTNGALRPLDGEQWVYFGGINTASGGGSVSQSVSTVAGTSYVVTYYVGQAGHGNFSLTGTASSGGTILASNRCVSVTGTWIQRQLNFTASSSNTVVTFADTSVADTLGGVVGLDYVTVVAETTTPVPPPPPPPVGPFVNGSFELLTNQAAIPSGGWAELTVGDTWLVRWIVGGPGNDLGVVNGTVNGIPPYDGEQWICFNGGNTPPGGSLSQTFLTVPGTNYAVSFYVYKTGTGNVSITATAQAAGGLLLASNYCAPAGGAWTQFQFSFTALTTNTTLEFLDSSIDTIAVDIELDDVTVVARGTAPVAPPPAVGPFVNGSFELLTNHAAIPSGGWAELTVGDTWLVGWTVGGPGNDLGVVNGTVNGISPSDGQQWISFNGGNTPPGGSLSQTFLTTPGSNYGVSFYVYKTGSGNVSITATASAPGGALLASNYCAPTAGAWTEYQMNFTATATNTTLEFLDSSIDTIAVDIELDDVSVVRDADSPPALPVITVSPLSQAAAAGAQVTFTAVASSGWTSVQWYLVNYLGTNAISSANTTNLVVTASGTTSGNYYAVFSNSAGSTTTSVAGLTVTGLSFQNGSFENINNHPPIAPGTSPAIYPGDTWLTGWTVGGPGGGDIVVANGSFPTISPYDGQQWIDFNGGNTAPGGSLSQTFTTTVGQSYLVSFVVEMVGTGTVSLTATALAAHSTLIASNYCVPATNSTWIPFQMSFTANSSNTTPELLT